MDTIKCGRVTYELTDGDTIMDNGACLQLVTRTVTKGWNKFSPLVSKKAFKLFKDMENVKIYEGHRYGDGVTLYKYSDA